MEVTELFPKSIAIVQIQAGGWSFFVRDRSGGVWGWGRMDGEEWAPRQAHLASPGAMVSGEPLKLDLPCTAVDISVGRRHLLVLDTDNLVWELKSFGKVSVIEPLSVVEPGRECHLALVTYFEPSSSHHPPSYSFHVHYRRCITHRHSSLPHLRVNPPTHNRQSHILTTTRLDPSTCRPSPGSGKSVLVGTYQPALLRAATFMPGGHWETSIDAWNLSPKTKPRHTRMMKTSTRLSLSSREKCRTHPCINFHPYPLRPRPTLRNDPKR